MSFTYRGLKAKLDRYLVTDKDVDSQIERMQQQNPRIAIITDRPTENGDEVVLDYAGYCDGVQFPGGTAENQTLVLGSGSFIPGFEEQLVGVNAGESKDVNVTFPAEYHATDLAGKDAVFACTVHKIQKKEMPELNDEFAQDVSEFDTFDEYKKSVRETVEKRKADQAKTAKENEAVDKLIESSEMDIPEAMVNSEVISMYQNYAQRLASQGIPIDMYLKYTGSTEEQMKEQMKPQALKQIQTRLVLEQVAKDADIQVSDERLDEEIEKIAKQYKMETDKLKAAMGDGEKEQMKKDIAVQEAISLIAENAREV